MKDFRKRIFQRIKNKAQRSNDDDDDESEFNCIEDSPVNGYNQQKTNLLKEKLGLLNKSSCNEILYSEKTLSGRGETPLSEDKSGNRDDNPLTDGLPSIRRT